jgi:two-component system chemotaxis sensor kinase CheA
MNPLLAVFVAEARDLLQEADEDLLALERTPDDADAINRLFRSVHTLKGSSGLFDAQALTRVLHAAEDMFQAVREHGLELTAEMVDIALKALDQTGRWIDHLDLHDGLPDDAEPIARALVAELRALFGRRTGEVLSDPALNARKDTSAPPAAITTWFVRAELAAAAKAGRVTLISYEPDAGCFFKGDDPLHLALQIPGLLALTVEPRTPWGLLSNLDPFACNLSVYALSTAGRGEVEALFRYVPDQVSLTEFDARMLAGEVEGHDPEAALPVIVERLLREQMDLLALPSPESEFAGRIKSAAKSSSNALRFGHRDATATVIDKAGAAALLQGTAEPLTKAIGAIIAAVLDISITEGSRDDPKSLVADVGLAALAAAERLTPKTLRVDQEKVDALMNLVGELVVAKNSLPFLARRAEHQFGLRDLGREIKDQYSVIDRIAQELQSAIMSVRMMPVGQVFQRFPRLVRDLSRKLGKQVDLVIEGEETEADKNVIETLFDPLLHMVRNSLDHGIEAPEDRIACGKTETATVRLLARHDGDQVVIEIIDDGRGIDPEVIKRKAYERGLLDEARLATITDDEATMLVFAAGFSTAAQISDVSGRGVGMDVVRNAVERAGGRIALASAKGSGTTVRLNLPLSMAVSRVMTVALDDRLFGIPMDLIHETVKIPRRDIMRVKHAEAFVLRDRVVPRLHLSKLLDLPDNRSANDEVAVLVVRIDSQTIGLGISSFGEGMEVILKPLEGLLARLTGYAGTALLGDGRVLLVLDLKELIQ